MKESLRAQRDPEGFSWGAWPPPHWMWLWGTPHWMWFWDHPTHNVILRGPPTECDFETTHTECDFEWPHTECDFETTPHWMGFWVTPHLMGFWDHPTLNVILSDPTLNGILRDPTLLFCTQRRRSHFFSPRSHPYLPCFAPLSRIERLSLHCSPNWKIMDLINWSLNAIDTIFGFRGTWLPRRNVRSGLYDGRVGEVANCVSCGSFREGHWRSTYSEPW